MRKLLPFLFLANSVFAADTVIAIKAARMVDGTGVPPVSNAVVIVTNNTDRKSTRLNSSHRT